MTSKLTYKIIEPQQAANACVIWLHGLGASADDFFSIAPRLMLDKTFNIRFIFPQAPVQPVTLNRGYEMPAWFDIYGLSLDSKQDESGIRTAETLLADLIAEQITAGIASDKIILVGFSQGGALVLHTALRYPQKLAGVMALSSYLPIADFLAEEKSVANQGLPVFIAHGTEDKVLPIVAAEITCSYLRDLNYQISEHIYSMGHEICWQEVVDISQWINKVLQVGERIMR